MICSLIMLSSFSPNSIPVVTAATGSSSHGVKRSSFRSRNRTGTCSSIPGTICLEGRGREEKEGGRGGGRREGKGEDI